MFYLFPLIFLAVFFTFWASYVFIFGERITMAQRVDQIIGSPAVTIREKELSLPFASRVIKPMLARVASVFVRILPSEKETILEKRLIQAGLIEKISPLELLVIKYLASFLLGFASLLISGILGMEIVKSLLLVLACLYGGLMLPEYYLSVRARRRNAELEASLPQILDLLTVSVEAGLGFDGAVYKVIGKTKGVLSFEFKRMMQEIKMGKVKREALKDLAGRFDVSDLNNFVSAIILGEQLGISIGNVMRRQADQIRLRRRLNAEEKAMKAPVKMLLPLVLLIFPALFIVILGPGAIQIYKSLLR